MKWFLLFIICSIRILFRVVLFLLSILVWWMVLMMVFRCVFIVLLGFNVIFFLRLIGFELLLFFLGWMKDVVSYLKFLVRFGFFVEGFFMKVKVVGILLVLVKVRDDVIFFKNFICLKLMVSLGLLEILDWLCGWEFW